MKTNINNVGQSGQKKTRAKKKSVVDFCFVVLLVAVATIEQHGASESHSS